ncbi:MAG TPA: GIY-YIG nuclease family protein [Thermomicrobiales bacterium]|nr:GIY-YIG nuclease family protein [Thermomicrobiales bacterium]
MKTYYAYIIASTAGRNATLYTGVTNNLERRAWEHQQRNKNTFAGKYGAVRVVWCQEFNQVLEAIDAEKRIKGWRRSKKIALIEAENPGWRDLMAG